MMMGGKGPVGMCATTAPGSMDVGGAVHLDGIAGDGTARYILVHFVGGPDSTALPAFMPGAGTANEWRLGARRA